MKIIIAVILCSLLQFSASAGEWKCGKLKLMFNENPTKSGDEFKLDGCYKT